LNRLLGSVVRTSRRRRGQAATRKWNARSVLGVELLEHRLNPGSVSPTNVTAIYDATAHTLDVSFKVALGSNDFPAYGAVFINGDAPSSSVDNTGDNLDGGATALGNGHDTMRFVANSFDGSVTYTFHYTNASILAANGHSGILNTTPADVFVVLYDNTSGTGGTATGSHSNIGTGPGYNTDNSYDNNGGSFNYRVISGLIDYNTSGKVNGSDDTPTTVLTGTLTTGSTTVTGLSSTSALYVGEYVSGSGIQAGTQIASIGPASGTITLTRTATTTGSKTLTFAQVTFFGYRIINGAVDLNRDGAISNGDTTSTLAGHPQFVVGSTSYNVISGKLDLNNDGKTDSKDTGFLDAEYACATPQIVNTNVAPVANPDTNSVTEDTAPNPVTGNVLTNDTDANGDTLSVSQVNGDSGNVGMAVSGTYGSVTINSDGSYSYTLDNSLAAVQALAAGQTVTDVFSYTASDGSDRKSVV